MGIYGLSTARALAVRRQDACRAKEVRQMEEEGVSGREGATGVAFGMLVSECGVFTT